jgi:hypothetical protein
MNITNMVSFALISGLSVAPWTSQASAAGRDAAIAKCTAKAHKQYPQEDNEHYGKSRTFVYKSCMFAAGFPA